MRRCKPPSTPSGKRAPVLGLLLLLSTLSTAAPPGARADRAASRAGLLTVEGLTSYRLANGLQVLLIPEPAQTKVTVAVTYFVGSRHEGYGETGMAHLLEHMLFKATPRFPEPDREVERRGGEWNAETEADWTYYYQTHLADQPAQDNLRFALAFEAERMTRARLVKADLDKEFSVVRNELEIGENSPAEILRQRILRAAFTWHGYGRDTIGSRSESMSRSSVRRSSARSESTSGCSSGVSAALVFVTAEASDGSTKSASRCCTFVPRCRPASIFASVRAKCHSVPCPYSRISQPICGTRGSSCISIKSCVPCICGVSVKRVDTLAKSP